MVCELPIEVASPVGEHKLQGLGLQCLQHTASVVTECGSRVPGLQYLWCRGLVARSMRNLSRPERGPVSPALAGGFLSTALPEKSHMSLLLMTIFKLLAKNAILLKIKNCVPDKVYETRTILQESFIKYTTETKIRRLQNFLRNDSSFSTYS